MVFVNMDSLQFYILLAEVDLRHDERPTTSNPRIPSSGWEGKNPTILGASKESSEVLHNLDEFRSQNGPRPLPKGSLDSFRVLESGLSSFKANKDVGSIPRERVNPSGDDMIPLLCQGASGRHHRSRFRHPPGKFRKMGVLGNLTAGETTGE